MATAAQRIIQTPKFVPWFGLMTDAAQDCDDIGNVYDLCALHLMGAGRFSWICIDTAVSAFQAQIQAIRACLADAGLPQVPVFQFNSAGVGGSGAWQNSLASLFGNYSAANVGHIAGLRQALASEPDHSGYIFMTGTGQALAALLADTSTTFSPLTGAQLLAQKLVTPAKSGGHAGCYWEAGWCPSNTSPVQNVNAVRPPATNIFTAITAAQYIVANWPTTPGGPQIAFVGDEQASNVTVQPPHASSLVSLDPYRMAYAIRLSSYTASETCWAAPGYIHGILGGVGLWKLGAVGGTMTIDSSGNNVWTTTPGNQAYLSTINYGVAQQAAGRTVMKALQDVHPAKPAPSTAAVSGFSDATAWWKGDTTPTGSGSTWASADLTGNGHALAIPSSISVAPTITANAVNGHSVITFGGSTMVSMGVDGVNSIAALMSGAATSYHIFLVLEVAASAVEQHVLDIGPAAGAAAHNLSRILAYVTSSAKWTASRVTSSVANLFPTFITGASGAYHIAEICFDAAQQTLFSQIFRLDELPVVTGTTLGSANLTLSTARLFGSEFANDAGFTSNHAFATGNLAEAAVYVGSVFYGEARMQRIRYLVNEYALTGEPE